MNVITTFMLAYDPVELIFGIKKGDADVRVGTLGLTSPSQPPDNLPAVALPSLASRELQNTSTSINRTISLSSSK